MKTRKLSTIDDMLVNAYVVLILAKEININEIPERLQKEVELRVAHKTIDILG